jgi:general secretion pathway protein L
VPRLLREGRAPLHELPPAAQTVLVMAAPDVLLLEAPWPHLETLSSDRVREALPNLLEESLIQPVEQCHFALGARDATRNVMTVAVVDLAWMRFVHEAFSGAGRSALKVVPAQLLQPQGALETLSATPALPDGGLEERTVLSWRGAAQSGWGLSLNAVEGLPALPQLPPGATPHPSAGLRGWALSGEAGGAVNLCQFAFAPPLGGLLERLRPWRPALLLLGLALLLQVLALNAYWAKLAWQKHQITQSMQALARDTLPNAPQDLSPALALKRALENQRAGQGGALPGDFSVLASRLAALLANEPGDALQQLDYRDDSFYLRFKPGAAVKSPMLHDEGRGVWRLSGGGR